MSVRQPVQHKLERLLVKPAGGPLHRVGRLDRVAQEAAREALVLGGGVGGAKGVEDRLRDCRDELRLD